MKPEVPFAQALARGLGLAFLQIRENRGLPSQDLVWQHCLEAKLYDSQCEPSRGPWMFHLLRAGGVHTAWLPRLVDALQDAVSNQVWVLDTYHQMDQLFEYARRQNPVARETYRKAAWASGVGSAQTLGHLLALEGLAVAPRMARELCEHLEPDGSFTYLHRFFVEELLARVSSEQAQQVLAGEPLFLKAWEKERAAPPEPAPDKEPPFWKLSAKASEAEALGPVEWAIEQVKQRGTKRYVVPRAWGRDLSFPQFERILKELRAHHGGPHERMLLRLLSRCAKFFDPWLLHLAESPEEALRLEAFEVLSWISHPSVRGYLEKKEREGPLNPETMRLARANYRPGDGLRFAQRLKESAHGVAVSEAHETHDLGLALLCIVSREPPQESFLPPKDILAAMVALYHYGPCSFCREQAVETLAEHDLVPEWMRAELPYDCNPGVPQAAGMQSVLSESPSSGSSQSEAVRKTEADENRSDR